MKPADLVIEVLAMKGFMPESSRTLLAQRFAILIGRLVKGSGAIANWNSVGMKAFLKDCELTEPPPRVDHALEIESSELAKFCNYWSDVSVFKDRGDWQPITANMNNLRQTLISELEMIAAGLTVPRK